MASSQANNYDEIWKLLEKFNFEIDAQLSVHVTCLICQKLLADAYQGPCGCNYCRKCIGDYLQKEKFCPGSTKDCKSKKLSFERNLIKDNGTNRKISKLRLKCPLNKCEYENELGDLVNHIKSCKFLPKYCPFEELGCQAGDLDNEGISEHLRAEICSHSQLMVKWIKNLKLNVEENIEKFQNHTGNQIKKQNQYYEREISILNEKCCKFENEISQLKTPSKSKINMLDSGQQDLVTSFKWTVSNLSQKRKVNHHVMSGYFYTNRKDFEIRLRLCLFDHHKPSGGDMSLKFYIHKGKHDVETVWPFRGNISIRMANKVNLNANMESSRYCEIPQPVLGCDSTKVFEFPNLDLQRLKVLESDSIIIECNITPV